MSNTIHNGSAAAIAAESVGRARWVHLIPVIFLMYTIAFFDRVNIGMALPSMSRDLALSPSQQGFVGGVFFWGYLPSFLAGGWLALRFGARPIPRRDPSCGSGARPRS